VSVSYYTDHSLTPTATNNYTDHSLHTHFSAAAILLSFVPSENTKAKCESPRIDTST
jgi:hypothetical protein